MGERKEKGETDMVGGESREEEEETGEKEGEGGER